MPVYACPVCFSDFKKWSACVMHMTTSACKEATSAEQEEPELQEHCRAAAEKPNRSKASVPFSLKKALGPQPFDVKVQIFRKVIDFQAGEGTEEGHAALRVWRTLSTADRQISDRVDSYVCSNSKLELIFSNF